MPYKNYGWKSDWITSTSTTSNIGSLAGGFYNFYKITPAGEQKKKEEVPMPETKEPGSNNHRAVLSLAMYARKHAKTYGFEEQWFDEVSFSNIQELLAKFFLKAHYSRGGIGNWREHCIGIGSKTYVKAVAKHTPLLDYDGKSIIKVVRADIKRLQEEKNLGPAWIYKTRRGFHVYFGADLVQTSDYLDIVQNSKCCEGFKRYVANHHIGVLRVSAKYTEFDISFQEVIFPAGQEKPARKLLTATIAHELITMGNECGTHFASLFPQWAKFREDMAPWTPKGTRKLQPKANPTAAATLSKPAVEPIKINASLSFEEACGMFQKLPKISTATIAKAVAAAQAEAVGEVVCDCGDPHCSIGAADLP